MFKNWCTRSNFLHFFKLLSLISLAAISAISTYLFILASLCFSKSCFSITWLMNFSMLTSLWLLSWSFFLITSPLALSILLYFYLIFWYLSLALYRTVFPIVRSSWVIWTLFLKQIKSCFILSIMCSKDFLFILASRSWLLVASCWDLRSVSLD